MVDAATATLPLTSACACLLSTSAGISGPDMWIKVSSITANLCNSASAVAFSLDADFTNGI